MFFLFTFFKNSVCNPKAKFVNKGSNTLFEVTSTGLLNIGWSYKLVKGCRPKSKLSFPVSLRLSPVEGPKGEASENSDNLIYNITYFNADCVCFLK